LPIAGPTTLALRPFKNAQEQLEATMAAMGGAPLAARSDLWQPYQASKADILREAQPVPELRARFPNETGLIEHAVAETGRPMATLRYLPMVGRNQAWTALIDPETAEPVGFLPLDSF
jgi:hypothetical protein